MKINGIWWPIISLNRFILTEAWLSLNWSLNWSLNNASISCARCRGFVYLLNNTTFCLIYECFICEFIISDHQHPKTLCQSGLTLGPDSKASAQPAGWFTQTVRLTWVITNDSRGKLWLYCNSTANCAKLAMLFCSYSGVWTLPCLPDFIRCRMLKQQKQRERKIIVHSNPKITSWFVYERNPRNLRTVVLNRQLSVVLSSIYLHLPSPTIVNTPGLSQRKCVV